MHIPPYLFPENFKPFVSESLLNELNTIWSSIVQTPLFKQIEHYLDAQDVSNQDSYVCNHTGSVVFPQVQPEISHLLGLLKPWRKGPFQVGTTFIDTEWKSNLKWKRLQPFLPELSQRTILDIGSSSGYYMHRCMEHNPKMVWGFDPYLQFFMQNRLLYGLHPKPNFYFTPLGIESLFNQNIRLDVILCMGILYHRRDPLDFLKQLKKLLHPSGTLLLETLIWPGTELTCFCPPKRYAGMPNVHFLPTKNCLLLWLEKSGYEIKEVSAENFTGLNEQRKTEWIDGHSLEEFLHKENLAMTREGYPPPCRIIIRAES
jgi:tRNA (mo5U34)-methyltransferase